MKQIVPEIYVNDCRNALDFYQDLFGGVIKNLQISDDMELFQDVKNKVIHSELHVNGRCVFYFVDIMEEKRSRTGNITVVLHMDDREEMERVYKGLSNNGTVLMELQTTFWGALHAIVTDRFGAPWALSFAK